MGRFGTYTIVATVGAISLLGVSAWVINDWVGRDRFAPCRSSAIAGGSATIGGAFTLVDETGKTVTDKDVFTRPSLVYFGYTFCPDVCPLDSARNAEAVDILSAQGYDVQPVFISFDPARDTPEVLAEFTDYIHPDMLGLTGTLEQINVASKAFRTYFKKQDGDEFYLMDHSTFTYLVLPETGFAEFFRRDFTPEKVAQVTACFLDNAG